MTISKSLSALPARGTLGDTSAQLLLTALAAQQASGTLYLRREGASVLLSMQNGELGVHADLGDEDGAVLDLAAAGTEFGFWSLTNAKLPTLPSRYPDALGPLWALPALSEQALLTTTETELRRLAARLAADAFSGALVLETPRGASSLTRGLLLFQAGQLGGAVCETGGQVQSGAAALRTLSQLEASLILFSLPEPVVASLLGWLLGLQLRSEAAPSGGVPEGFSGLELAATAARYYRAGRVYLQLPRPSGRPADPVGLFASCQRAPSLTLPSEPHGWEGQRYGLTLRGRDALNPMTELAMRFQSDFGQIGKRVLENFRRDRTAEVVAEAVDLGPEDLKKIVERLEQGGFIRMVGHAPSDASPTPYLQPR